MSMKNKIATLCFFFVGAAAHGQQLRTVLTPYLVQLSRANRMSGFNESVYRCEKLEGTHAGNKITFRVEASGGAGGYKHLLSYKLSTDFAFKEKAAEALQFEESRRGNGDITIELPELDPQVPFVDVSFFLYTEDKRGQTVTDIKQIRVSRTVILTRSKNDVQEQKGCFQRYEAYLSSPGLVSNGSSNTSRLEIRQGVDQIWSSNRGWQFGVYVSPLSWLGLGNLLALNYSYFQNKSKQVTESTYVSSQYDLDPGDYLQVYVQPTRYVTAYDAGIVHPCGQVRTIEGAYLFQWWAFSYHVYPVSPNLDEGNPDPRLVGAPPRDTCSERISDARFTRTN
jgi:hypothetical protein